MTPRRALVTRPLAQALDWCERLRALGVDAQALPLIDIAASPDVTALAAWFSTLAGGPPRIYRNALGQFGSFGDIEAFPAP